MAKRMINRARRWRPKADDPHGEDKRRLVDYLIENEITAENPITLKELLRSARFSQRYTREALQHNLLGPLRRDPQLFVGTSNRGVFLVTSRIDVDTTLEFYTSRIRAELRHARNLRTLAKRAGLKKGGQPARGWTGKGQAVIYIDESGNPDVKDLAPRVFVVAAVVIESRQDVAELDRRFANAAAVIQRPLDHELRTAGLSVAKHARVLHELSLIEYQWAAACFHKHRLTSPGFEDPKTLYRYAFQFLIGELLTVVWQADLVIDEHSADRFQRQLERYLRKQSVGLPLNRLNSIRFGSSSKIRLIQLADLVAGAVRRSTAGEPGPLDEIEHQMINLQHWPPQ
jgi:Protein of unknown function (DUF3800)